MSAMHNQSDRPSVVLRLIFETTGALLLRDVTAALYGVELLYDFVALAIGDHHRDYVFDDRFFKRSGRPLEDSELLRVRSIVTEPAPAVELDAAALPTLATALVIRQHVRFWDVDRARLSQLVDAMRRNVDRLDYADTELIARVERAGSTETGSKVFRGILSGMESLSRRIALRSVDIQW